MITLFQATMGGNDWGIFYDLISRTGSSSQMLFIGYIAFYQIALMNIVTSVFIDKTLELAQPDVEILLLEKQQKDTADAKELVQFCVELDKDSSGTISLEEFH